jgi:uncharacterized membrane protein YdcZ (DUF606 family)
MDRAVALILALAAGGLVAFQPPANAQLAHHVGDLGAAFVSLLISFAIVTVLLFVAGQSSTCWAESPARASSRSRWWRSGRSGRAA